MDEKESTTRLGRLGRINLNSIKEYPDHFTQGIWPANLPSKPKNFGDNAFHGRTHPEICFVALERYTQPGDVVWDPMAGSGTVSDVCAEMNCKCIATDINPAREDIKQQDARHWHPGDETIDLIFLHPPYMDIVDYDPKGGLATDNLDQWLLAMTHVLDQCWLALKPDHVMVVILGSVYRNKAGVKQMIALDMELNPLVEGFRLLGRVIRPYGETKGGKTSGGKNEGLWKYRRLNTGLWALDQDAVLFYQKC